MERGEKNGGRDKNFFANCPSFKEDTSHLLWQGFIQRGETLGAPPPPPPWGRVLRNSLATKMAE